MKQAMGMLLTGPSQCIRRPATGFVNEVVKEGEALHLPIDGRNRY